MKFFVPYLRLPVKYMKVTLGIVAIYIFTAIIWANISVSLYNDPWKNFERLTESHPSFNPSSFSLGGSHDGFQKSEDQLPKGILKLLKQQQKYQFQWSDWINMTDPFYKPRREVIKLNLTTTSTKVVDVTHEVCNYTHYFTLGRDARINYTECSGHDYLLKTNPQPERIIFLTNKPVHEENNESPKRDFRITDTEQKSVKDTGYYLENLQSVVTEMSKKYKEYDPFLHFGKKYKKWSLDTLPHVFPYAKYRYQLKKKVTLNGLEKVAYDIYRLFHDVPSYLSSEPSFMVSSLYEITNDEMRRRINLDVEINNMFPAALEQLDPQSSFGKSKMTLTKDRLILGKDQGLESLTMQPADWKMPVQKNIEALYHANFIQDTLKTPEKNASKYFREAVHHRDYYHHDFKFYQRQFTDLEQTAIIHRLFRAWAKFSEAEGIVSWLSHGTLVGWFWNGASMPWDTDIDLQMPVAELDRLARKFNNSLIVEMPDIGGGRYFLEVGPRYLNRTKGNTENAIDARFIDALSGVYIDLTGIAQHPEKKEKYGCKNNHFYTADELFPLHLTSFEGMPTYVPNNYHKVMHDEYKTYRNSTFKDWIFDRQLAQWVHKKRCPKKVKLIEEMNKHYDKNEVLEAPMFVEEDMEMYCNEEAKYVYEKYKHITKRHQQEMLYLEKLRAKKTDLAYLEPEEREILAGFALEVPAAFDHPMSF